MIAFAMRFLGSRGSSVGVALCWREKSKQSVSKQSSLHCEILRVKRTIHSPGSSQWSKNKTVGKFLSADGKFGENLEVTHDVFIVFSLSDRFGSVGLIL